ncbi:MAG TPA: glycosyltransferase family 1 protein [Methylomirabilota bacterium]|nr:glycosyltransferase family 1 protein [Methylomirabilota bacterium]
MKILLVSNYFPDRQHSMQRFATMLRDGLRARGHEVRVLRPRPVFTRASLLKGKQRKWLAYLDKFIVFPRVLRKASRWADVVHICDHSNAMYVAHLASKPHVVTCHDLLAVRGALGESTDCPATFTGKFLQRWILRSLRRAQMVTCVSSATRADLLRIGGGSLQSRSCVILLGVAATLTGSSHLFPGEPPLKPGRAFLLNVGSNLRRKNRDGALRIFKQVGQQFDCDLVFAGEPLSPELKQLKNEIGLNGNVIEVPRPSDAMLKTLYSNAFALLYPTKYEGFGWPAIEAQQCGCPVVSSRSTSIPEVVGDSALLRAPDDEEGFAADVLKLTDATVRQQLIARGFENVKRFTPERMVNDYIEAYQKVCARN